MSNANTPAQKRETQQIDKTGDRPFEGVAIICALPPDGQKGTVLEVEARDGIKTILELSRLEAYALPPAEREARRP